MRKPYTRLPLPEVSPINNASTIALPYLSVRLGAKAGQRTPRFDAIVDSDSPWCLFRADIAKLLKLDLSTGILDEVAGVDGLAMKTYFHKIKIYVENDWVIEVLAGFVEGLQVNGLLGRNGFFDNFHVHFDHTDRENPSLEVRRIDRPN